ncbi:MAG: WecB/TagA/CpsF family glycosyltransferase [Candidatus Hydrogenedentota bacterium]
MTKANEQAMIDAAPTASVADVTASTPNKPDHEEVCGVPMARMDFQELCAAIGERIRQRTPGFVVTPNVDHICLFHRRADMRAAYREAFLALPDGIPLLWAARLLGRPLKEKLSGSDLVPSLSAWAAKEGHSVFCFGAAEGVAEKAAQKLQEQYPGLKVAGVYSPPLGFEGDPMENRRAIDAIRKARPDICFVALGCPKQELWLLEHYEDIGVPVSLGIGAGLDFVAGKVRRAPRCVQRIGLEWLWRLLQEPRRLWRRYLVEDALFFSLVWRDFRGTLLTHR